MWDILGHCEVICVVGLVYAIWPKISECVSVLSCVSPAQLSILHMEYIAPFLQQGVFASCLWPFVSFARYANGV